VIADSCWSGDLAMRSGGAAITSFEHDAVLIRSLTLKSRHIMSSGGDEPVADGGGGGHSVFTGALLQSLNDMEGDSFTAESLLVQRIQPRVAGRSQQTPEYAIVRDSDADLGDFVFFRKKTDRGNMPPVRADVSPRPDKTPDQPVRSDKPAVGGDGAGRPAANMAQLQSFDPPAISALKKPAVEDRAATTTSVLINSRFKVDGPPEAQTVLDTQTGLMWTRSDYWNAKKTFATNWADALNWAKELNSSRYGGYSDWSVPNLKQYRTINHSKADRDTYLKVFQKTDATEFWSNETPGPYVTSYIDFVEGYAVSGDRHRTDLPFSVRLVRVVNPHGSLNRNGGPLPVRNQPTLVAQRRTKKAALNRVKD
jgi:hypothetical protein